MRLVSYARREQRRPAAEVRRHRLERLGVWYERLSFPFAVAILFANPQFRPKYEMTWRKKVALGVRFYRNTRRIRTGLSYKAHLAMAAKLLEMPANVPGAVVECGCWLGGTTTNLSLICDVVGRDLIVYDSFEGLPARDGDDMNPAVQGSFKGELDVVRDNVAALWVHRPLFVPQRLVRRHAAVTHRTYCVVPDRC